MLAGLILVAGVLYFKGYWEPKEPLEEPSPQPIQQQEPEIVTRSIEVEPRRMGPVENSPPQPTPSIPEEVRARNDLANRAIQSFNDGNYDTAINLFSELARTDSQAFLGLGLSYYKLGDYRSAARFLEQSIGEPNVDEFMVRKVLAFTYYRLDELNESQKNAKAALTIRNDMEVRALLEKLAREMPSQDDFIEEETLHFKVLFDGYEHGQMSRTVLDILEEAYNTVGVELNHFPRDPITVILYTGEEFHDVTGMPEWSGGMFDGKIRVPLRGLEQQSPELLRKILYHEYTHALIYSITSACPKWIHEGLATYLSGEVRQQVGQEIPLTSLELAFPSSQQQGLLAYDISYSAVTDLINEYGIYSFKIFLDELSKGNNIEGAFRTAFLVSYTEFTETWGDG